MKLDFNSTTLIWKCIDWCFTMESFQKCLLNFCLFSQEYWLMETPSTQTILLGKIYNLYLFFQRKKKLNHTWTADSLLELLWLVWPEDLAMSVAPVVSFICFKYSTSLNTFLSPPPGLCLTLSKDPTLLATFKSIFRFSICKFGRVKGRRKKVLWVGIKSTKTFKSQERKHSHSQRNTHSINNCNQISK